jgi:type I restriction enzyme S subunit
MLEQPISNAGWTQVRFDQMATQVNDRVDNPAEAGVEFYVGLEHLDPDSLRIRRWGEPTDVESTKLRFKAGDIIFGKRRVYQRKVAVAEFEGICSAHAMVLRAKSDAVLPDFLPFFMQSDFFMERALSISVGSLSPTINWKALAAEEFLMPPIQEQARLCDALRAAHELVTSYRVALENARDVYRATIDMFFSDFDADKNNQGPAVGNRKIYELFEASIQVTDGVHQTPTYVDEGVPFISVENLKNGPGINMASKRFITQAAYAEYIKRAHPQKGDVLLAGKGATLGAARVVETDEPFSIFVSVALIKPNRKILGNV